ncbi:hypothetical protein KTC92_17895 [Clostridium sp. CM027]|uniref:hypothetical protein n=1 Tax=Clostridium sp. CM027 TaxID=2849865 RepID=UPI001C6ECAC8|nr:hypothetical protein [Clostridium sp. CM027]MBW9145930.1 hypothetical protein [Clostridium sp. CM027]UVE40906.1 hypothetical protein KTC92_17895 [Clostridium sp. CM027]
MILIWIIGKKCIDSSANRWRRAYKKEGILGLRDMRKESSGRHRDKELSTLNILKLPMNT